MSMARATRLIAPVVAFNLIAMALIVVAGEFYVRKAHIANTTEWGDNALAMCLPDQNRIWRYKAGVDFSYKTNELQFRIRTNALALRGEALIQDDSSPLVLFIGDSFTFGWGVEENARFSEIARDLLAAEQNRHVSIINAGHWMYTFDQQLITLKEMLNKYRPKIVVQGLFWPHVRTLFGHELFYERQELASVSHPGLRCDETGVLRFRSDWLERPPLNSQLIASIARRLLNANFVRSAADIEQLLRQDQPFINELWSLTANHLRETAVIVQRTGAAYVPLYIPVNVELADKFWRDTFGKDRPVGVDLSLPRRYFESFLSGMGVRLVVPEFREHDYFAIDPHWNEGGHTKAAKALVPVISSLLIEKR
jgi:hypothetical protein